MEQGKTAKLSDEENEQWFDVLNDKIEVDKGIFLNDRVLFQKRQEIKAMTT